MGFGPLDENAVTRGAMTSLNASVCNIVAIGVLENKSKELKGHFNNVTTNYIKTLLEV